MFFSIFFIVLGSVYLCSAFHSPHLYLTRSKAFKRILMSTSMTTSSFLSSMSPISHVTDFISSHPHSFSSFCLSDTSISEEDVLEVTGTANNLPDPLYAIGFAAIIFLGVGILQFSLGDLTKEEGQARVRDFLKTRGDTERKRGYFD